MQSDHQTSGKRTPCVLILGATLLAGVAVGLEEGFSVEELVTRIEPLAPTPERLEAVRLDSGAILLRHEFKSTIETIDAGLDLLAEIPARRKIVILGDVSEPPESQGTRYRRIGARVAEIATQAIFSGYKRQTYVAGAVKAGMPRGPRPSACMACAICLRCDG